jgi:hypothetical protein
VWIFSFFCFNNSFLQEPQTKVEKNLILCLFRGDIQNEKIVCTNMEKNARCSNNALQPLFLKHELHRYKTTREKFE